MSPQITAHQTRTTRFRGRSATFAGLVLLLPAASCGPRQVLIATDAPMRIERPTDLSNARMIVETTSDDGAIVIECDGVTLDLGGSELIGAGGETPADQFTGRGIVVRGAKNVTIRNAVIRGFAIAVYAEDAPGLVIESCDLSRNYRQRLKSTPEKEHVDDWIFGHENDDNEWLRFGAGIYLLRCPGATVKNCRARDGQNGLCLVRCDESTVVGNDMSFMSGWGLALWRSSRCRVIGNRFDYCIRGYSHGVYARGQDSTGILVYEQCSDNVFAYNSATHGGDGFFLYAGHETTRRTGEGGCNRNLVYMNDFSHAVANGIEATFSDQNVFLGNKLTHCTHGIWAGYSRRSLIQDNTIEDCTHGVSIEHGRANRIFWNRFARCRDGVWLWWDDDKDLLASPFCKKQGGDSSNEYIERNEFTDCALAVRAHDTQHLVVNGSVFMNCEAALRLTGNTTVQRFVGNIIFGGVLENQTAHELSGRHNLIARGARIIGPELLDMPAAERIEAWSAVHHGPEYHQKDDPHPWTWVRAREMNIPAVSGGPPDRMGTQPLAPLPGIPEGLQYVTITDGGPEIRQPPANR